MMAFGGARGAMRSDYSHYYCEVPSSTTMTYEGILNEAYFKLNSKEEKKTINMEILQLKIQFQMKKRYG